MSADEKLFKLRKERDKLLSQIEDFQYQGKRAYSRFLRIQDKLTIIVKKMIKI